MTNENFDIVFIGGGPGGYVGAIRAAQLGHKVGVIEKGPTLGGTCLNVGCIPSKALLDSSEHYAACLHELNDHGIKLEGVGLDLAKMMARKEKIVKDLTGGIEFLFKKNGVTRILGKGSLVSANQIEVTTPDGSKAMVSGRKIVLATGSVPNELPFLKFDGKYILSSTEALSLTQVPKRMIVVGAGVIGLELGSVWLRLGADVTVVESAGNICGAMDLSTSKRLLQILKKQGMKFELDAKVLGAEIQNNQATVNFEGLKDGQKKAVTGDVVLVATGRRPFSDGLGLEKLGIKKDARGTVEVDEHFQTNVSGIYAIGDLIRGPMLAHKAEEEGVAVAEIISGLAGHVNYEACPGVVYTWPEVASVGATEEQLKAQRHAYNAGTFPFTANGRAKAMGHTDGQVKILADATTDRVLGVHIIGPRASDMIAEAAIAMEFSASSEDIARSFHAHPTLAEVMREAALAVDKRARQM